MTMTGVFSRYLNRNAFLDKVVVSIRGGRKESPQLAVRNKLNRATGGVGRKYARKQQGLLVSSENPYDLVYGPMRLVGILPSGVLTLRSAGSPVTIGQIEEVVGGIYDTGWNASVSQVELTFDFTWLSTDWFWFRIFSSARKFVAWPDENAAEKTLYIGGRTSPWQAKVYEKTEGVTRLEFTLRRPFLLQQGITEIRELEKLRTLDLGSRLWLRELNRSALKSLECRVGKPEDMRRRALVTFSQDIVHRDFIPAAEKLFGAVPGSLLRPSPVVQEQMRRMQSRLVV